MADKTGQIHTYQTYTRNGWVVHAHQAYPRALADLAVTVPGTVTLEPVDASPYARVFKGDMEINGTPYGVYLKQYLYRSFKDKLKHLIRSGRAKRNHAASILLTQHGFHCPLVIATACYRPWALGLPGMRDLPYCAASSTVTLSVTNTTPLESYFYQIKDTPRRTAFLKALGQEIGRLHGLHIFHGDLRTGNVLVQAQKDAWLFWLLDNERTCQFASLPQRLRVKNLVQIHLFVKDLTNTDRWRFFQAYCQAAAIDRVNQKVLARQVIKRTKQREQARPDRME